MSSGMKITRPTRASPHPIPARASREFTPQKRNRAGVSPYSPGGRFLDSRKSRPSRLPVLKAPFRANLSIRRRHVKWKTARKETRYHNFVHDRLAQNRYTGPSMSARRLALIVFVLCATVYAQSASLNAEQETHHASDHCCGLCHLGPTPILPATANAIAAPVFSQVWLAVTAVVSTPHQVLDSSAASRAPPA
jgi:hypothetical protein